MHSPFDTPTRREWLRVGGLGAFGLTLPALLDARAAQAKPPKAKSVIMLFLLGAPPQHESWDPKPDAPAEIRGEFKPIATRTPGLQICELMPKTAKLTEKIAVLRAVQTRDNAHSSSGFTMSTGVNHAPQSVENVKPGAPNDWPSIGAIVRRFRAGEGGFPSAVTLPHQAANTGNIQWPGQDAGFLGRAYDPWLLTGDPNEAKFTIEGLSLPDNIPANRLEHRHGLLTSLEKRFARYEATASETPHAARTRQAFDLMSSPAATGAFDLSREEPKLRDRYGRTRFGQSCLLARRLVEAGVPFVRVNWTPVPKALNMGTWDTHDKNAQGVREISPILDSAYSALLEDLGDRGMLDDTLVIWMGEFGRTPKINPAAGRDHWGSVFSMALAGGGAKGGAVYGASDSQGAFPKDGLVRPSDVTATIFHTLGIPLGSEITNTLGQPLPITRGEPVKAVLA